MKILKVHIAVNIAVLHDGEFFIEGGANIRMRTRSYKVSSAVVSQWRKRRLESRDHGVLTLLSEHVESQVVHLRVTT